MVFSATVSDELAVGDWVFRSGIGRESAMIKMLSNSEYSHIGVVVAIVPEVLIVHATTSDDLERPNQVLLSTYDTFSDTKYAQFTAAARPTFLNLAQQANIAQHLLAQVGKPFVLTTADEQPRYCTTIIAEAIQTQLPDFALDWQRVDLPLVGGAYLFPQAFAELSSLKWLDIEQ